MYESLFTHSIEDSSALSRACRTCRTKSAPLPYGRGSVIPLGRIGGSFTGRWIALFLCTALLVPGDILADESSDVMTIDDVARIKSVSSAVISPDGNLIAYTLRVQRKPGKDENGRAWSELHLVDRAGRSRRFVTGEVNVGNVQWTPDGDSISYTAKRGDDEHSALYVIPIDGGESRRVLAPDTGVGDYDWHPDGLRVAFLAKPEKDKDKEKLEDKGFNPEVYEEELRYTRIWIAETETDTDSDDAPRMLEIEGSANSVQWSPDGTRLVSGVSPTPLIDDIYMQQRVRIIDAESGDIVQKFDNPGKLGAIRWSPNGSQIAFVSGVDIHDPAAGQLMVAPVSGGDFRSVTADFTPHVSNIRWQDAHTIMFAADDGCQSVVGEVRADGSDRKIHIPPRGPVLGDMTLSADGQSAAFVGSSPMHPGEVYLSTHSNKEPKRLTDSNPWLADKRLAKQEVVSYTARDGERVEGVLIYPLDKQSNKRYPLILCVHGGPESRIPNAWLTRYAYPGQVGAAQGYAVFYPNYRGSTGRGVAFTKAHQADYGGKEFNDLIDGVDHLIEMGLVDGDKVGITGGSYGGFATAWCSTYHTERFAAGVMFVGISDQISKSGTTDIAEEMYLVHARKRIWDDWQFFLERSPIYYVEKARTPLLILHGKEDTRVHPSQSMEMYRNLKILGNTPVRLVFYPGEGHGNRKAASRYDYNMRLMRWMDHYLKGPGGDPPSADLDYGLDMDDDDEKTDTAESKKAA